ncbi:MAG TPA: phosphotransferase [Chitinophaga sp.]|uniref:phosphotransferase family protein n=1 Tax=Chitinophaga sp. TaxID=1869181 RepID=UPI002DC04965|nr:phosphotransferase [Chitinophaga sp.]HEU4551181.1 phosphotransferase [Chitinophaga sp.]
MKRQWESEVALNPQKVRRLLQTAVPALTIQSVQTLGSGWDNELFLVNGRLVFRFCKRSFAVPFIQLEIRALPLLAPLLPVPVPHILYNGTFGNNFPFFAYEMLPGKMAANLYMTDAERAALAQPMAQFAHRLHTIPVTPEIQAVIPNDQIGRMDIAKRTRIIRESLYVTGSLGIDFDPAIAEALFAAISQADVNARRTIVHGDLYSRNILVQHRQQLCGIIDWSDVHLGNPAKDLAFAVSFLPPAAFPRFRDAYPGFDDTLLRLALFAALYLTCYLSVFALDIQDAPLVAECKTSFNNIAANYHTYLS